MSRVELIFKNIGVSAIMLSSCMTSATAQTIYKPPKSHNPQALTNIKPQKLQPNILITQSQSELNQEQSRISSQQQINKSRSLEISQATETEQIDQAPEPDEAIESEADKLKEPEPASEFERLEQDPNRLNLPSLPEEVEININEPITLEQALALSIRNNKDLETARLNLVRSQNSLQEARAAKYPTLGFQTRYQNSNSAASQRQRDIARSTNPRRVEDFDTVPSTIIDDGSENLFDGTLSLNYNVYTGGRRGADISRAKKTVELNELTVEQITEQALFEAARDYYELQNSNAQVDIAAAAVEDAQQTLRDAQLLEQAGLGTRFDVLRAEVELANADQGLTIANANQSTARRQLAETLSLGQQVNLETADEIQEAGVWDQSLEETIILAYDNRAELAQLLVRREINEQQRRINISAIKPQINLFANYEFLEILDDRANFADGYAVGAQLQWSIFDGGTALARSRQSETDKLIDQTTFANQRNQVRLEVEQAYFSLQANKENIATSEKAVEQAEESLRLARLRFQAGVGTQTAVIQSQTELTTARGNRLDAIINYNQSLNQLFRAVNGLAALNQNLQNLNQ